jgi:hypothetical protein
VTLESGEVSPSTSFTFSVVCVPSPCLGSEPPQLRQKQPCLLKEKDLRVGMARKHLGEALADPRFGPRLPPSTSLLSRCLW